MIDAKAALAIYKAVPIDRPLTAREILGRLNPALDCSQQGLRQTLQRLVRRDMIIEGRRQSAG
jgi:hypothetical protein